MSTTSSAVTQATPNASDGRPRRRWFTGPLMILRTCLRTTGAFHHHGLLALGPLFFVLLLFAVVLYLINAIAPVAPFVYSLI
ncbi:MAG: hypothetical protein VX938_05155 [Myxococcota bacterium]|nr:hypothetical protein [Myxococcota bacterium]